MHYTVEHACERLKKDGMLNIWGQNFYRDFKEGAKEMGIKFSCLKCGKDNYKIKLISPKKDINKKRRRRDNDICFVR